ncbi:unnamed protein product [Menidia menidia]|uniref:(Atlantic silverside) hypothetical protein n=1 Tax=Menidia menidia TaxID=238744 RepID=A0A8S4ANI4_9TELE|nr:unnamed protein product [Menidia menidia]
MGNGRKASCLLCQRSEETKITGALSTKEQVTAHQNCLLFSSGIFCTDSPLLDDLFGFSVDDVLDEVKRGSRLLCYHCKKKGATAGCENKRCKKSFHYPCAVQGGAEIFEDHQHGKFGLYCLKHRKQSNGDYARAFQRHQFSNNSSEAGPSKAIPLQPEHLLREEEENSFKRKSVNWNRIVSDDSSDSDKELIPPLESDIEESQNLATEDAESESLLPPVGGAAPSPPPPAAPAQLPRVVSVEIQTLKRECDSESQPCLLRGSPETPMLGMETKITALAPALNRAPPPPPPNRAPPPPPAGPAPRPSVPPPPPANPAPTVDSAAFWRSCNAAGCTQALFTHLVEGLKDVCSRIHTHQASQEDFDWALSVMEASGKLGEFVSRQQEELQRKQMELLTAAAAMKEVVSALKK